MQMVVISIVLAMATGIVAAGLAQSLWAMATGERPQLEMLETFGLATPIKVLVLIVCAPVLLARVAWRLLDGAPVPGMGVLAVAGLWSFVQGVFILSQVFRIA